METKFQEVKRKLTHDLRRTRNKRVALYKKYSNDEISPEVWNKDDLLLQGMYRGLVLALKRISEYEI